MPGLRVLVAQVDNRPLNESATLGTAGYSSLSAALNHHYCKHHGYDYLLIQPTVDLGKVLADKTSASAHLIEKDGRQTIGAYHPGLRQFRAVSWAKLPVLLYLLLQIGGHYDLIWYMDSDIGISDATSGRSLKEKFDVWASGEQCLGPKRTTPCVNWGLEDVYSTPMLLFPNSPYGDKEPCAGSFMLRPPKAASMINDWWNLDMPDKNFALMHEQDALWNLTSGLRTDALHAYYNGSIPPSLMTQRTVTLLQEFQFPPRDDRQQYCVEGKQWLCHIITTFSEFRAPVFRQMLLRMENGAYTETHFKAAMRYIKNHLSLRLDVVEAAEQVQKHQRELRENNVLRPPEDLPPLLLPHGLRYVPVERREKPSETSKTTGNL
jgi:hypothetical protein